MLKTAPNISPGARAVLELPLAGMTEYPGTIVVIDRYGKPLVATGKVALADAGDMPEPPAVFRARTATEDADVWFRRADGGSDCLSVVAVPLVNAAGTWRGARGVCRKVTDQRRSDGDAAHGHLRDRLVTH